MKREIIVKYKKKRIKIPAEKCSVFRQFSGLMFSRREKAKILLFDSKTGQNMIIHSFFVFYPFIAIWLDEKNNVADIKIVSPFNPCISPSKPSYRLVEIPINKSCKKFLNFFFPTVIRNI